MTEHAPPQGYEPPSLEDREDFAAKAVPVVQGYLREIGKDWSPRYLNLLCNAKPKTKAEQAILDVLLDRMAAAYPGAEYPRICKRPARLAASGRHLN